MVSFKSIIITTAAGMALTIGGMADARDLRIAPGTPPAHPGNGHLYVPFAEYIAEETEGAITANILGPEVVSLGQMRDGLQTGLVDVGLLLPLYFPAELPNFSLIGEIALSGSDPHAMAAAIAEFNINCNACQNELTEFGVVYLGSGSSDQYALLTNEPVHTIADIRGLRLRSGGAPFSRWAENFGAVPVSVSVLETFEAMSQGTIDGTMASIGDLLSFRLVELAKNVTVIPLGTYFATSNFTTASNAWQSMTVEERTAMARAANRANFDMTQYWGYDFPKIAHAAAIKAGIEIFNADPAFETASKEFAIADRVTAATISADRFGMTDAEQRVKEFMSLVEKWEAISVELKRDHNAIAVRFWDDVWSKVDFATYGN